MATKHNHPYRFAVAQRTLRNLLSDLEILAGDKVGPSDVTVRDVLNTALVNAEVLARQLAAAKAGDVAEGPLVFPSPNDRGDDET